MVHRVAKSWTRLKQLSTHACTHICTYIYLSILLHYGLSQDTDYSSLCSTIEPCCQRLFLKIGKVSVGLWKADELIPRVTEGLVWVYTQGSRQESWESVCIAAPWSGNQPLSLPASQVTHWKPGVDTLLFTKGLEWERPQLGGYNLTLFTPRGTSISLTNTPLWHVSAKILRFCIERRDLSSMEAEATMWVCPEGFSTWARVSRAAGRWTPRSSPSPISSYGGAGQAEPPGSTPDPGLRGLVQHRLSGTQEVTEQVRKKGIPCKGLWTSFCKRQGWRIRNTEEGNSGGSVPGHSMSVNEGTQHVVQWNVPYATDKRLYYNENLKSHCHSICNPTNPPFSRLLTYTIHGFDLTILNTCCCISSVGATKNAINISVSLGCL